MTKAWNHAYYIICAMAALLSTLPPELVSILPEKWKPYIAGASVAAMWLKAHWNLFVNPDGTDARVPYEPKKQG